MQRVAESRSGLRGMADSGEVAEMPFRWPPATMLGMMREVMNDLVTSCLMLAGTSSKAA